MGKKGQPFYRIVAADSRSPRDGKFIQEIGTYNPVKADAPVTLDKDAALEWLKKAHSLPTPSAAFFLKKAL